MWDNIFIISFSISQIIYLFLQTYFVEEYFELLGCEKSSFNLFYFAEYKKFIQDNVSENDWQASYTGYLANRRNGFFVRLILCPFCASFWLSLLGCLLFSSISYTFFVSFIACLGYFILHSLVKLSKK